MRTWLLVLSILAFCCLVLCQQREEADGGNDLGQDVDDSQGGLNPSNNDENGTTTANTMSK